MIDRLALLADLQKLLRKLEADLLARSNCEELPDIRDSLKMEFDRAKKAKRTGLSQSEWTSDMITQIAAAWTLSCVFVRFLEDNKLISPPKISGPGETLQIARDQHHLYFSSQSRRGESDWDYLINVFSELKTTAGGVFNEHNPVWKFPNWLSGDAAKLILEFFQSKNADTGELSHDFTDPDWKTRFLGDLYQDLSEAARKKYALLQTPDFVEAFILDRTLEPALSEFGLKGFKMIDPACGSGHFVLGAFDRILSHWRREEPGTNAQELVQRALDSVNGVDCNPYAISIARFRLLLASLKASGIKRLSEAPNFQMNFAVADSLYHGRQRQATLAGMETDETHFFQTEDIDEANKILREGTYDCVVANPPYITPKDKAANTAYRELYPRVCHMKYSLSVPFMERIFSLAKRGQGASQPAGYTGQITANSFMKREFGKKLIESYFSTVDLTHVIDTSGAYIPGHGTPTTILFGRNRVSVSEKLRTVMGIRGEPSTPDDPAQGLVWSSIVSLVDQSGKQNEFVSSSDSERTLFYKHPWSIGGGGASELKEQLEENACKILEELGDSIGITCFTLEDDLYIIPNETAFRASMNRQMFRTMVIGDTVRDWCVAENEVSVFPYTETYQPIEDDPNDPSLRYLWFGRTGLANNKMFGGKTKVECGLRWYEYGRLTYHKLQKPLSIVFGEVATHNHFVLDRGGKVFNRTAPVIKLPGDATEEDHLVLLGLLNSSCACFWMTQTCHNKGGGASVSKLAPEKWENFYGFNGTAIEKLPLPKGRPLFRTKALDQLAQALWSHSPHIVLAERQMEYNVSERRGFTSLRETLLVAQRQWESILSQMIAAQEDLDWECYNLYELVEDDLTEASSESNITPWFPISLGQRAFEIVLGRRMAAGETQSTWFERHGSTPITELPAHWPEEYKQLVDRRIELIENDPNIRLIEQPEYKRRWNTESWESQLERALREWLLLRLETYFDFDGRMSESNQLSVVSDQSDPKPEIRKLKTDNVPPLASIQLVSVGKMTDVASQDSEFMEVAELYRNDPTFNVLSLVQELVLDESVPLLPVLRYKQSGLRKRAEWEQTWELQRQEDVLEKQIRNELDGRLSADAKGKLGISSDNCPAGSLAEIAFGLDVPGAKQGMTNVWLDIDTIVRRVQTAKVGAVPVPPKYTSVDFISTGGAKFWKLRGKLDVPKERWVSFPRCNGADGTMMIAWAGYDHLQLARAISTYYVEVRDHLGGSDDPRLIPLLSCLVELLPWLKQWHNEIDEEFDLRMDEYFERFVSSQVSARGLSMEDVRKWKP